MSNSINPNLLPSANIKSGDTHASTIKNTIVSGRNKSGSSSTIETASAATDLDSSTQAKLSSLQLPPPHPTASSSDDSILNTPVLFNINTLLDMILASGTKTSLEMGVEQGTLANQQVQFTEQGADATYDADMKSANAMIVGGALSIVTGVVTAGLAIFSAGMEAAGEVVEDAADVTEEGIEGAEGLGEEGEGDEGGVGGADDVGLDVDEGYGADSEDDINEGDNEIEDKESDNAKKIEDVSNNKGGEGTGDADDAVKDGGDSKKGESPKGKRGKVFNMAKALSKALPMAVSTGMEGVSKAVEGSMQKAAAPMRKVAGYDQATAQLCKASFDEAQSTVQSTDKLCESVLQAHNQNNQFLTQIAQGYRG